jgi:hypothetical protein
VSFRQTRRCFLQTLAAIAAAPLVPWRPPGADPEAFTGELVGVDWGAGEASSVWTFAWFEGLGGPLRIKSIGRCTEREALRLVPPWPLVEHGTALRGKR